MCRKKTPGSNGIWRLAVRKGNTYRFHSKTQPRRLGVIENAEGARAEK